MISQLTPNRHSVACIRPRQKQMPICLSAGTTALLSWPGLLQGRGSGASPRKVALPRCVRGTLAARCCAMLQGSHPPINPPPCLTERIQSLNMQICVMNTSAASPGLGHLHLKSSDASWLEILPIRHVGILLHSASLGQMGEFPPLAATLRKSSLPGGMEVRYSHQYLKDKEFWRSHKSDQEWLYILSTSRKVPKRLYGPLQALSRAWEISECSDPQLRCLL